MFAMQKDNSKSRKSIDDLRAMQRQSSMIKMNALHQEYLRRKAKSDWKRFIPFYQTLIGNK